MEKYQLKALFESIKTDDLKSFSSIMLSKSDLNICFGRFPILSLCYMYQSYKILEKYEKFMLSIKNYVVVEEYFDMYLKFKRHAKKSLKLYIGENKIINPIEMLAVLNEKFLLVKNYKFLFKNEEILQNLQKIYKINNKLEIKATYQNIEIPKQKLRKSNLLIACVASILFLIISMFSVFSFVFVADKFGVGTYKNPIKITTEEELQTAIKNGSKFYSIQNDILLTKEWTASKFKGTMLGNGHIIQAGEYLVDGFLKELNGTIKDLTINANLTKNIQSNFAIFTTKSTGLIENCKISGDFTFETYNDEDVYISLVVAENDGTINLCEVEAEVTLKNNRQSNAFFSAIAGINNGMVSNSITTNGAVNADTVDISGIVTQNNGTIQHCENNLKISQTSNKEWHPNTAGICVNNNGTIEFCTNKAEVFAQSTLKTAPVGDNNEAQSMAVICGGVVCDNSGVIKSSNNFGKVKALGDVSMVYAGGITARNLLEENFPSVSKSKSECDIEVYSEQSQVYVGGVAGFNASEIDNCGFIGKITAETDSSDADIKLIAGGVVGYNRECMLQNSYAKVEFVNSNLKDNNFLYGGVAGFVGSIMGHALSGVLNNHYVINSSFDCASYAIIYSISSSSLVMLNSESHSENFKAHQSLEDISSEVLLND